MKKQQKEVILMYSGGLDSLLACIRLINTGYKVNLIHYDNGSIIGTERVQEGIKQLKKRYKDKVEYIGIGSTAGIFREYRGLNNIENLPAKEIAKKFEQLTISQYRCLLCRMSMYTYTIALAKSKKINYIAEGARKSQLFGIEQIELINEFKNLCNKYNIKLLLPVYEIEDDFKKETEILRNGIAPIAYEPKCLLGYPMKKPLNIVQLKELKDLYISLRKEQEKDIEDISFQYRLKNFPHPKDKIEWL